MSVYNKLRAIDLSDITDPALATHINTVLSFADQEDELDANELAQVEKVYNRAVAHLNKNAEKAAAEAKRIANEESEATQQLQREQEAIDQINAIEYPHTALLKQVKTNEFQKRQGAWLMLLGRLKKKPLDEAAKKAVMENSEKLATDIKAHLDKQQSQQSAEETERLAREAAAQQETDRVNAETLATENKRKEKEAASTGNVYLDTIFGRA